MNDVPRIVDPAGKAAGKSPSGKLIATESIPEPWVVIYREGERMVMRDIPCLAVVETPLGDIHLVGVTNTLTPYAWDDPNVMEYMPRVEAQRRQKEMAALQTKREKEARKHERNLRDPQQRVHRHGRLQHSGRRIHRNQRRDDHLHDNEWIARVLDG